MRSTRSSSRRFQIRTTARPPSLDCGERLTAIATACLTWSSHPPQTTRHRPTGCGTIAYDDEQGHLLFHVHTTLGLKAHSATGHTSHLLSARVQFLAELLVIEVTAPAMTRPRNSDLYDVPLLTFGP